MRDPHKYTWAPRPQNGDSLGAAKGIAIALIVGSLFWTAVWFVLR